MSGKTRSALTSRACYFSHSRLFSRLPCRLTRVMEKTPLSKFIRNYTRDSSGVFSLSSLVRISTGRHFALLRCCLCKNTLVRMYIIKRILHGGLKIYIDYLIESATYGFLFPSCKTLENERVSAANE